MKVNNHTPFNDFSEISGKTKIYFLILIVFSVGIILISLINMQDMQASSARATKDFVETFTMQTTKSVSQEVDSRKRMLMTIADSMSKINDLSEESRVVEFLDRKRTICGFDFVIYMDLEKDQVTVSGQLPKGFEDTTQGLLKIETIRQAVSSLESSVGMENENTIYASVIKGEGDKAKVFIGGNSADTMRNIIRSHVFEDESYSCIINMDGTVILSSEYKEPFQNLEAVFRGEPGSIKDELLRMQERIYQRQSGILQFDSYHNKELYLSYVPMGLNDWTMLTITPTDLFSGMSDEFTERALICVIGTALVFLGFFGLLFHHYNTNRKNLEKLAYSDEITGGINNIAFQKIYRQFHEHNDSDRYSIILMDVMDFKAVNERFGISVGNRMLKYFYDTIQKHLEQEKFELTVRSEMDHFFLCLQESDPHRIQQRIDGIIDDINSFADTDLPKYRITFKQGGCITDDKALDISLLQDRARMALKSVKPGSKSECIFYNEQMAEEKQWERELEKRFDTAILNNEFEPYIQPKVSISRNMVAGGEMLVRWRHPEKGIVSPMEFIPILEDNGKICILDYYMFEKACRWLSERKKQGKPLYPISVNLSRNHFWRPDFLDQFVKIAQQYGVERKYLEFEMTEGIFIDDEGMGKVREGIQKIHEYGFKCAIDDFGVGYSSLSLIKEFDIDTLKLDRSFFVNLESDKAVGIIRCLVELADQLHIQTVVEGIETEDQIEFLKTVHCDIVQGYFFSRPLPVEEFNQWDDAFHH